MYGKYHQNWENAEEIFKQVKRGDYTFLSLISWDETLEVDVKILHEFGDTYGLAVKFAKDKSFGKMYEKEEHEVIGYFASFRIRS